MSCKVDLVIKFDKTKLETPKAEAINCAVELLKMCVATKLNCIVVHGAGSFGHHHAHQYGVNKGMPTTPSPGDATRKGFALTRLSVTKLNHLLTTAFVDAGLPAVANSPCGSWQTCKGEVVKDNLAAIASLLHAGFIPITHGDCVLDSDKGCAILSGDTIIKVICEKMQPSRVVFLSDVMGVYSKPPQEPDAELLRRITVNVDGTLDCAVSTSKLTQDITGGIRLKLDTAIRILQQSNGKTEVFICGINTIAAQNACRHGNLEQEDGTWLNLKCT